MVNPIWFDDKWLHYSSKCNKEAEHLHEGHNGWSMGYLNTHVDTQVPRWALCAQRTVTISMTYVCSWLIAHCTQHAKSTSFIPNMISRSYAIYQSNMPEKIYYYCYILFIHYRERKIPNDLMWEVVSHVPRLQVKRHTMHWTSVGQMKKTHRYR